MYSLVKQFCEYINNLTPATTVAEQLPVATDATEEMQNAGIVCADVPQAIVSAPMLTLFGSIKKYYNDLSDEVFCSTEEYNSQERVKELARKYSSMNVMEQSQLRDRYENSLKDAIENVIRADNPTAEMQRSALNDDLDLVRFKENCHKDLKIAKKEFKTVFGQSELDKVLAKMPVHNTPKSTRGYKSNNSTFCI